MEPGQPGQPGAESAGTGDVQPHPSLLLHSQAEAVMLSLAKQQLERCKQERCRAPCGMRLMLLLVK